MCFSQIEQGSVPQEAHVDVVLESGVERLVAEASKLRAYMPPRNSKPTHMLIFGDNGVELRSAGTTSQKGYRVDFLKFDRGARAGNLSKRQPLPTAIGRDTKAVVDATAGFGKDALRLALMGYTVTAIERSPVVAALLRDGLWRANQDPSLKKAIGGRLVLVESDAEEWFKNNPNTGVIFLDPMFPPKRKKSALPPGHIQLLQSVVGYDHDVTTKQLFHAAMEFATQRVVVKRPNYAPCIGAHPVATHKGKLVRYEVYHPHCRRS